MSPVRFLVAPLIKKSCSIRAAFFVSYKNFKYILCDSVTLCLKQNAKETEKYCLSKENTLYYLDIRKKKTTFAPINHRFT